MTSIPVSEMEKEMKYCDFADAMNEFENQNVISMYWD